MDFLQNYLISVMWPSKGKVYSEHMAYITKRRKYQVLNDLIWNIMEIYLQQDAREVSAQSFLNAATSLPLLGKKGQIEVQYILPYECIEIQELKILDHVSVFLPP